MWLEQRFEEADGGFLRSGDPPPVAGRAAIGGERCIDAALAVGIVGAAAAGCVVDRLIVAAASSSNCFCNSSISNLSSASVVRALDG